jgi:glycosyltransferase involved in cell wall biosynthesis
VPPAARAPRVAVIIPCFNDADTLRFAVASTRLVAEEVEVVVVDDGSTDETTLARLAELETGGTRVVHQANQGPSAAAMAGLRSTSAPYILRLDADDLLVEGALTDLADALDSDSEAGAAWGDVQTFGIASFRIPSVPRLDPWLITYVNCVPGAGSMFRREALEDSGGWRLRDGFEDWDIWMSLAERGHRGVYIPRVGFLYRRDDSGRHMGSVPRMTEHYEALRRLHAPLFDERAANRKSSDAPPSLKLAVDAVEGTPGLSRLARVQLCELFTHLFWNGGIRLTAPMVAAAVTLRVRAQWRNTRAPQAAKW